jgi:hypothetical protein
MPRGISFTDEDVNVKELSHLLACQAVALKRLSANQIKARLRFASGVADLRSSLRSKRRSGAEGIRTPDPHNAIVVLYQLSYDPV